MRKTYQTENEGYVIHPRFGVEHLESPVPDIVAVDGSVTKGKGAHFRTADPAAINRFDHLVELKYLSVVSEEPEYEEPVAARVEAAPEPVAVEDAFTVMKSAVVELGSTVIGYRSHDMARFVDVSGSLTITPGVKVKAQDQMGAEILAVLEKEKTVAKE